MKTLIHDIFNEIREVSDKLSWSRGVVLAREQKVSCTKLDEDESKFQVVAPNRNIPSTCKLWLEDQDWSCDCGSKLDPCEHVIASIIFIKQNFEHGISLNKEAKTSFTKKIRYDLTTNYEQQVLFSRQIDDGTSQKVFTYSLFSSFLKDEGVTPNSIDLSIEKKLGDQLAGALSPLVWSDIQPFLIQLEELFLDNKPVKFQKERIGFECLIQDESNGVQLQIKQDHRIKTFFTNGLALTNAGIHIVSRCGLDVDTIAAHQQGTYFAPSQLSYVASELLPKIKRSIPTVIKGQNLPIHEESRPRLVIETTINQRKLIATPFIVYGEPEIARILHGQLKLKNSNHTPIRNITLEQKLLDKAKKELQLSSDHQNIFEKQHAIALAQHLQKWQGDITGDVLEAFKVFEVDEFKLSFKDNHLSIHPLLQNSTTLKQNPAIDITTAINAWEQNETHIPLLDGGWIPLPKQWLQLYGPTIKELLESMSQEGKLPNSTKPIIANLMQSQMQELPSELVDYKDLLQNFQPSSPWKTPSHIKATLRHYQEDGVRWINQLKKIKMNGLLADDMGLGKTLQTICSLDGKSLIIAPTSVISNWKKEIERFRPSYKAKVYHGAKRDLGGAWDVLITTYALLRMDEDLLQSIDWDCIVLDEAQNIKNPQSQVSQTAYRMHSRFKLCLTGTPIENRLEELWSQFHFLNPGYLGQLKGFKERYVSVSVDNDSIQQLRNKIKPFILRRKKKDVAKELPPKTEVTLECELSQEEQHIYDSMLISQKQEVLKLIQSGGRVIEVLELLLRLRQACCAPKLINKEYQVSSSKIQLLMEDLESLHETESKALVFSQWTSYLDLIEAELKNSAISYARIDGQTQNRQKIVDTFQSESGPDVLLISLKAGGSGLNLTAADHVYIMDPWWNPAVEDQAADRAYRIGQTKPVLVKKLIAKGTVEEKILALQEHKRAIAGSVLEGTGKAFEMTKEDLIALFE